MSFEFPFYDIRFFAFQIIQGEEYGKRKIVNGSQCFFLGLVITWSAQAVATKPTLTLEMAKKIADACEALQQEKAFRPVVIAIQDGGGDMKLLRRQDNAFLGSILGAEMKATSSSSFPFPSRLYGELAFGKDGAPGPLPGIAELAGHAAFPGGLPILTKDGAHIGSVGVSGAASADDDEECAQAGLNAIADML